MKKTCIVILFLLLTFPVSADSIFTQAEIRRLSEAKNLLSDCETRSTNEIVKELSATGAPREHLAVYETIAATFRDISKDYGKEDTPSRKRLLDQIRMNMAYFQFGGSKAEKAGGSELNRLIQRKLKHYLPKDLWGNPNLFHSLE